MASGKRWEYSGKRKEVGMFKGIFNENNRRDVLQGICALDISARLELTSPAPAACMHIVPAGKFHDDPARIPN